MLWDTHIHTNFSFDSTESPQNQLKAASKSGLKGICITDHLDYDGPAQDSTFLFDPPIYFKELLALKASNPPIPLHIGVELGLQPHLSKKHAVLLSDHPFDFVIGSSHLINGMDPYDKEFFEAMPEDEGYLQYFLSIKENIIAFDGFDVYGHLDYIVRYGPNKNRFYSYHKYSDLIDEILRLLIARGKGIELNTGGFRYGLNHPNPTEDIIRRYRELGGEIITLGSDAHRSSQLGYDFHKIPAILEAAGFRYYTVFAQRKPTFLKLST